MANGLNGKGVAAPKLQGIEHLALQGPKPSVLKCCRNRKNPLLRLVVSRLANQATFDLQLVSLYLDQKEMGSFSCCHIDMLLAN